MNTVKQLLGIALLSLLCSSCHDWLDVSPESEVKYDDLFSYKNGFKDQLTGVYTALCAEDLYGAHLTYGMMDALGQQYVWEQETGNYYYLNRFEYNNATSISIIDGIWSKMYNTIANVNILLQGIQEHRGVLSATEESVFEGEAYALRAFLHFDLLRLFGKSYASGAYEKAIPYVTSISKEVTPLSTVAQTIDYVIGDLEKASTLLRDTDPICTGENSTFLGTRTFHLNYYAVRALLARAYLFKNDKTQALACAKEVIQSQQFPWVESGKVVTSIRDLRDGIFTSECIFMLNNTKLESLTNTYLKEGAETSTGNLLLMSPAVCDEIFETSLYGFDWRYNYYFTALKGTYVGSTKLWQVAEDYNNRQPLLRQSELWLIAAECSPKEDAIYYINTLREHRGFDASSMLSANEVSDENVQDIIGKEYRKEFIGEGQWFFYCKRKDLETLPNVVVPFSKAYYVLPMPDQEKDYGDRN